MYEMAIVSVDAKYCRARFLAQGEKFFIHAFSPRLSDLFSMAAFGWEGAQVDSLGCKSVFNL